jgi:hypothetical protein
MRVQRGRGAVTLRYVHCRGRLSRGGHEEAALLLSSVTRQHAARVEELSLALRSSAQ